MTTVTRCGTIRRLRYHREVERRFRVRPTTSGFGDLIPIAVLALGGFCAFTNMGLLSPLLTDISRDFGVSEALTGQISTASALTMTVGALVASPWMDRFSRRRWIRGEAAVMLIGVIGAAVAPSFGWLLVARMLGALAPRSDCDIASPVPAS